MALFFLPILIKQKIKKIKKKIIKLNNSSKKHKDKDNKATWRKLIKITQKPIKFAHLIMLMNNYSNKNQINVNYKLPK